MNALRAGSATGSRLPEWMGAQPRMLELVVHADDLAISVGIRTPEFPAEVFAPVRDLLVRLAVRRHGQSAVISALTRRERTPVISAF